MPLHRPPNRQGHWFAGHLALAKALSAARQGAGSQGQWRSLSPVREMLAVSRALSALASGDCDGLDWMLLNEEKNRRALL